MKVPTKINSTQKDIRIKGRLIINTFHPGAIKKEEPWYDSIMEIVERFKSEGLFAK